MESKQLLAGVLIALLAAACAPLVIPGKVMLKLGQSAGDASQSVEITFIEVLEDSRCPVDAVCIWAGRVKVLLEIGYGTEIQQYTLTLGQLLEGDIDSIAVGEYMITLIRVDPYPLVSQPVDPADYQITLNIQS